MEEIKKTKIKEVFRFCQDGIIGFGGLKPTVRHLTFTLPTST